MDNILIFAVLKHWLLQQRETEASFVYTLWVKKQDTKLLPITSPNINRFSNFFTDGLGGKFATNLCLNIPPHIKDVATLPCKIRMSEK